MTASDNVELQGSLILRGIIKHEDLIWFIARGNMIMLRVCLIFFGTITPKKHFFPFPVGDGALSDECCANPGILRKALCYQQGIHGQ